MSPVREAQLAKARVELENIKSAIRQGIVTQSTKEMLEAAERRVAGLEGELKAPAVEGKIAVLPSLVQLYLNDLKGSLGRDTDRARALLAKLVGQITGVFPPDEVADLGHELYVGQFLINRDGEGIAEGRAGVQTVIFRWYHNRRGSSKAITHPSEIR